MSLISISYYLWSENERKEEWGGIRGIRVGECDWLVAKSAQLIRDSPRLLIVHLGLVPCTRLPNLLSKILDDLIIVLVYAE